jgi:hypothetical protein
MADNPNPNPNALQCSIDDATSSGVYVNFANIVHNPAEFVIDFGRIVPGRPDVRIHSRVITSPLHAKQFLNALAQNVAIYEKNFGTIRLDFEGQRTEGTGTLPPN